MVFGNRFGKLGIVASATHSYRENFVKERRACYALPESTTPWLTPAAT